MEPGPPKDGRWIRGVRAALAIVGSSLILAALTPTMSGAVSGSVPGSQGINPSPKPTDSAVTVTGRGSFKGLSVTVNQTRDLVNQPISVTWSGGTGTTSFGGQPFNGVFDANFMAVFQCWGDASTSDPLTAVNPGPQPQQCEVGGAAVNASRAYPTGGNQTSATPSATRILAFPGDPNYAKYQAAGGVPDPSQGNVLFEPFRAVDGTVVNVSENVNAVSDPNQSFWLNPYFSYNDTNEIDYGRTYPDGTGNQLFVTDTGLEAPGLGCGQKIQPLPDGSTKSPQCWLVVVPQASISSSPLTPDAWANRIAIPLSFQAVDSPCTFGKSERRLDGSELAAGAISSWQPTLCTQPGTIPFSYTPLGDSLARAQLSSATATGAQMAVLTDPIPSSSIDPSNPAVYAPITLSSLVIAFNIERVPTLDQSGNPNAQEAPLFTTRVGTIRLTPRLVAKLLTESYTAELRGLTSSAAQSYPWTAHNAGYLFTDPDFQQFNPEFSLLQSAFGTNAAQLVTEFGSADSTAALWQWIVADPEASAWLAGIPDPWGMVVNPIYSTTTYVNTSGTAFSLQGLDSFPKSSPYCAPPPGLVIAGAQVSPACILNWSPYSLSMREAAHDTQTTNTGSKTTTNPQAATADQYYASDGAQTSGFKVVMSLTDSASAARYGLQTADLSQAADDGPSRQFISPDASGVLAGEKSMTPSAGLPTLLVPNPATTTPGAYPLSLLTYATTFPQSLDSSARKDFARFVTYAVGPGQVQGTAFGQLPPGYVPLPFNLRQVAVNVAKSVLAAGSSPSGSTRIPGSQPSSSGAGIAPASLSGSASGLGSSVTAPASNPIAPSSVTTIQKQALAAVRTPNTRSGFLRLLIPIAAVTFVATLIAAFALSMPTIRQRIARSTRKIGGQPQLFTGGKDNVHS